MYSTCIPNLSITKSGVVTGCASIPHTFLNIVTHAPIVQSEAHEKCVTTILTLFIPFWFSTILFVHVSIETSNIIKRTSHCMY